jgi:hypothetical protein
MIEQELAFGLERPNVLASRPKKLRTSWTRRQSLATLAPVLEDMVLLRILRRAQLWEYGKPTIAQSTLVQRLLKLGLAGELYLPGSSGLD